MIITASILVSVFRQKLGKLYYCKNRKCIKDTIENKIHSSFFPPSFLWVFGYYSKEWSYVKQEWEADITKSIANMG